MGNHKCTYRENGNFTLTALSRAYVLSQLKKILLSWRLCLLSELFGLQQDPFLTHFIFIVLMKGQLTRHWDLGVFLHFEHAQSGDFGQSMGWCCVVNIFFALLPRQSTSPVPFFCLPSPNLAMLVTPNQDINVLIHKKTPIHVISFSSYEL